MRTMTKRDIIYNYVTADNDKEKQFYGKMAEKINLGVSNTKLVKLTK
jgi:hypothetical protein